ncbi:MAG: hypothetical protein AAFP17_17895 [Pseudomonadota bacterium]
MRAWAGRLLANRIDRPTPFTLRAFSMKAATKRRWEVTVFAKDRQASYLRWLETGGEQAPKKRAHVLPVEAGRNRYGNMRKGVVKRLLASVNAFSGVPRGGGRPGGLYQRVGARPGRRAGRRLRLMVAYEKSTSYEPMLGFQAGGRRLVRRIVGEKMRAAMEYAIRTARRN